MALRYRLTIILLGIALVGGVGLAHEGWRWTQVRHYNHAIEQGNFADAGPYGGDYGLFAEAYAKQQEGRFQQARILYSKVEDTPAKSLGTAALFNLGNTYLQQASLIDLKKDPDLALPLLELAKVSYRDLLRIDPRHWGAKYNLERVLQLSPDVGDQPLLEIEGRRSTVRTVISADPEGALP
ncbi:MAG: hypothetical protein EXR86_05000 [Gammaproteobacteria bacterium]|nr:hypothetical protein [Gammaproteobacteria bacterium]